MTPDLVVLVLGAAVLHVGWNVLLKQSGDPLRTAAGAMVAAGIASIPIGLALGPGGVGAGPVGAALGTPAARVDPAVAFTVVAIAVVSGAVEAVYLVLLSAAYRRGDLSIVYPTARGTAPVLAALVGFGILGERLGGPGVVGVALLLVGLAALVRPWRIVAASRSDPGTWREDPAVLATATGIAIATYTALDRVAVRLVDPWWYGALVWPSMAIWTVLAERFVAHRRALGASRAAAVDPPGDEGSGRAVAAGLLSYAAYGLVLLALSSAPLTAVAPLRESAIVVASGWGALRMGEGRSRRDVLARVGAAVVVVLGAALLALD